MGVTRREFLAVSGALGAGLALSSLGIDLGPLNAYAEEIKKTEEILGVQLIEQSGSKREGYHLTETGRSFMESFLAWFDEVERNALEKAKQRLPWCVSGYNYEGEQSSKSSQKE